MTFSALNNTQIRDLRTLLEDNQVELKQQLELATKSAEPVALDQQSVGRVSRIDAIQQQQMSVASRDQASLMLKQVNAALERIELNEYGLCIECAEPIGIARLRAQPHTPNCLDCQSALENS